MTMKLITLPCDKGDIDIKELGRYAPVTEGVAKVGIARFPAGARHPKEGLKGNPEREISYILEGAFTLHLEDGDHMVKAGDLVIFEPGEAQGSTALEDSRVLYFLQD